MQTNSIIYFSTPTSLQAQTSTVSQSSTPSTSPTILPSGPSAQPAVTPLNPSSPALPTIPFAPLESAKEVEVLRPTSQATPSADARASTEVAIIAGAQSQQPAISSSPPLSAITIASAAIGGVIVVTLIIVVSVIIMRWRAARQDEERRIQEDSVSNGYNGSIRRSRDKRPGDEGSFSPGAQTQDVETGVQMSRGAGPPPAGRGMAEIGNPNGFAVTERTREFPQAGRTNILEAPENPFRSELDSPGSANEGRDRGRNAQSSAREYNRTSDPFSRRISLTPFDRTLSDEQRLGQASDSPTKGYFGDRGSEWSVATLTTEQPGNLPRVGQSRGVSALEREAELIRSRFPEASRDLDQANFDRSNLRAPPTVETSNGMRVPAAALERRVSKGSMDTLDSETFQKLLFDVQSGPF
ncbi:hypothetical protein IFR05_006610 [Cadophora sp. M221]|nr:hypothetical protein IFR05_006610 [Cadophora sp. M221]